MILRLAAYGLLIVGLGLAFWFMVLPLLRNRPSFAEFNRVSETRSQAIWLKLDTIKTKLLAVLLVVANGMVAAHDFLLPFATGVDWTPVSEMVPAAVWPFVGMGFSALFFWLRMVTAKSESQKLVAVEAGTVTAQEAITGNPEAMSIVKAGVEPPAVEKPE